MHVALLHGAALGSGVLTVHSIEQATARSGRDGFNKGAEAAVAALLQIAAARRWRHHRARPNPMTASTQAPRARTAARVAAVQALFQSEQGPENPETVIDQFVRHRLGELPGTGGYEEGRVPDAHVKLFGRIVRMAAEKQDQLDTILGGRLARRMAPRAPGPGVARLAARRRRAELAMRDGPPARVVINEYLRWSAHGFFAGEEPAYGQWAA